MSRPSTSMRASAASTWTTSVPSERSPRRGAVDRGAVGACGSVGVREPQGAVGARSPAAASARWRRRSRRRRQCRQRGTATSRAPRRADDQRPIACQRSRHAPRVVALERRAAASDAGASRASATAPARRGPTRRRRRPRSSRRSRAPRDRATAACRRLLGQHRRQELVERRRNLRPQASAAVGGASVRCMRTRSARVVGLERPPPQDHLVGDDAERVDVGLAVDVLGARLLGRRCSRAYRRPARSSSAADATTGRWRRSSSLGEISLATPKSSSLTAVAPSAHRAQEDVGRLQVAVNDSLFVRRVERVAHLVEDVERLVERRACDPTCDRRASSPCSHSMTK